VRSVLVSASMTLLGDWNWYLPKWLSWPPNLQIEGHVQQPKLEALETVPGDEGTCQHRCVAPGSGGGARKRRRGGVP
jgi:hypothetical protein